MLPDNENPLLILASASRTRHRILQAAGLQFAVMPAGVDEPAMRKAMDAEQVRVKPPGVAERLARAKAEFVSRQHPEAIVIGSDQVLAFEDAIVTKPRDEERARETLMRLRGHVHHLHSAVALAEGGQVLWSMTDTAALAMRDFSEAFLDDYLVRGGAEICHAVGAYQIEGPGIQLFESIEGDYFTILGLPLLPLLSELRRRKVIGT